MSLRDRFSTIDRVAIPAGLLDEARARASSPEDRLGDGPGRGTKVAVIALGLGVTVASVAALYVAFSRSLQSAGDAPPPIAAQVVCNEAGTEADPEVQAQADGVHLLVRNDLNTNPGFLVNYQSGGGMGVNLRPSDVTEVVVAAAPGWIRVGCGGIPSEQADRFPQIEVVDPMGYFVSPDLECGETGLSSLGTGPVEGTGPEDAATKAFASFLKPGDVIEPAGYPEAKPILLRLVRSGAPLAIVSVSKTEGTWIADDPRGCAYLLPG